MDCLSSRLLAYQKMVAPGHFLEKTLHTLAHLNPINPSATVAFWSKKHIVLVTVIGTVICIIVVSAKAFQFYKQRNLAALKKQAQQNLAEVESLNTKERDHITSASDQELLKIQRFFALETQEVQARTDLTRIQSQFYNTLEELNALSNALHTLYSEEASERTQIHSALAQALSHTQERSSIETQEVQARTDLTRIQSQFYNTLEELNALSNALHTLYSEEASERTQIHSALAQALSHTQERSSIETQEVQARTDLTRIQSQFYNTLEELNALSNALHTLYSEEASERTQIHAALAQSLSHTQERSSIETQEVQARTDLTRIQSQFYNTLEELNALSNALHTLYSEEASERTQIHSALAQALSHTQERSSIETQEVQARTDLTRIQSQFYNTLEELNALSNALHTLYSEEASERTQIHSALAQALSHTQERSSIETLESEKRAELHRMQSQMQHTLEELNTQSHSLHTIYTEEATERQMLAQKIRLEQGIRALEQKEIASRDFLSNQGHTFFSILRGILDTQIDLDHEKRELSAYEAAELATSKAGSIARSLSPWKPDHIREEASPDPRPPHAIRTLQLLPVNQFQGAVSPKFPITKPDDSISAAAPPCDSTEIGKVESDQRYDVILDENWSRASLLQIHKLFFLTHVPSRADGKTSEVDTTLLSPMRVRVRDQRSRSAVANTKKELFKPLFQQGIKRQPLQASITNRPLASVERNFFRETTPLRERSHLSAQQISSIPTPSLYEGAEPDEEKLLQQENRYDPNASELNFDNTLYKAYNASQRQRSQSSLPQHTRSVTEPLATSKTGNVKNQEASRPRLSRTKAFQFLYVKRAIEKGTEPSAHLTRSGTSSDI